MKTLPVHIVREADQWVTTAVAAELCNVSIRWVQLYKKKFEYRRPKKRNLEFELTSVLLVRLELMKNAA